MTVRTFLKKLILPVAAVGLMIAVIAAAPSFAWYRENPANFGTAHIKGTIRADYFEHGTGTAEDPFIIHTATHFYNFAWLQYLGYFNDEDEVVYFELCDGSDCLIGNGISAVNGVRTLDMEGRTIPPIGTAEFPFIGHFEGNGVAITNVSISNSATPDDFYEFPIKEGKTTKKGGGLAVWAPETDSTVAGVFGVVGEYNENGTEANENTCIQNVYLDNVTVETKTSETVVGLVAGYVNAPVENVGVSNSRIVVGGSVSGTVSGLTNKISDYTLIGYCKEDYRGYASTVEKSVTVGEPQQKPVNSGSGEGDKWGGSINMKNLYNRLIAVQNAATNTGKYASSAIITIDERSDGDPLVEYTYTDTTNSKGFKNFKNDKVPEAGSFSFSAYDQGTFSDQYLYLYGRDDKHFTQEQITITLKDQDVAAYLIRSGGYYLNRTDRHTVSSSDTDTSAQKWAKEDAGNGTFYLYYYELGEKYYLNNSGVTLQIDKEKAATRWTIDTVNNTINTTFDNRAYYLAFDGLSSGWKLIPAVSYRIVSGGKALGATTTGVSTTTESRWYFTGTEAAPGNVYTVIGSQKYYLLQNGNAVTVQSNPATPTVWYVQDGTFYCISNGLNYYLTYSIATGWELQTILKYKIASGANYLSAVSGGIVNQDSANATEWTFSTTGDNPSGDISATVDGTPYYLTCTASDTNGLGLSTSASTKWINDNGLLYCEPVVTGTPTVRYYLMYDNGWCAKPLKYYISYTSGGTTHYLSDSGSGTAVADQTSQANATAWIFSEPGSQPAGTIHSGRQYLNANVGSWGRNSSLKMSSSGNTWENGSTNLYYTDTTIWGSTQYFIRYNNGWTISSNKNATGTAVTITPTITLTALSFYGSVDSTKEPPQTALNRVNEGITLTLTATTLQVQERSGPVTVPAEYPYDTWFPLSVEAKDILDDSGNVTQAASYDPLATNNDNNTSIAVDGGTNTGYVISGSACPTTSSKWPYRVGDIRVSRYSMTDIGVALNDSTSYGDGTKLEVLTVTPYTNGNVQRISDVYNKSNTNVSARLSGYTKTDAETLGLTKYNDFYVNNELISLGARSNLHNVFSGQSNIYGLHFMNAAIDKDDYVVAPVVKINGKTYYDYQLPRHSVDFNLKEDGRITFFAGTYFSGNNSFFSLHHIQRNDDQTIASIKEIEYVYQRGEGDNAEYYYQYADGSYSDGYSHQAGDTVAFDLKWITDPAGSGVDFINNAVYYFEIPANAGEYALGSVAGKTGAYLFYLDIAANNVVKMEWVSTITDSTITRTYEFPKGVDIVENPGDPIGITPSATIRLPGDTSGTTVELYRTGDTVYHTGPPGTDSTYTATLADANAEYDGETPAIILSSLAHKTGESDAKGDIFSTEGETEITKDNQHIAESITLLRKVDSAEAKVDVVPIRIDETIVETDVPVEAAEAQSLQYSALPSQSDSAVTSLLKSLGNLLSAVSANETSETLMGTLLRYAQPRSLAMRTVGSSASGTTDSGAYPWAKLSDKSLVTWVQEKANADYLREVLGDTGSAAYKSLQSRVKKVITPTIYREVSGRLNDLLRSDVEWVVQEKADDSDEAFCAWLLDPKNAEAIRATLMEPESSAYTELFARLSHVVNDGMYFEAFRYLQQLLVVNSEPEAMTDEEFLELLLDEANLDTLLEILEDPESAEYKEFFEQFDNMEDPELKQAAETRIQEVLDILSRVNPWALMTDEEFAAWLLDEANAETILEILDDSDGDAYKRVFRRLNRMKDSVLKEQLQDRVQELFDILNPPAPWRGMTDEEFAAWLLDEVNAEAILEILNDPENAFHAALYERLAAVEDPALKEQLQDRVQELFDILNPPAPWRGMTDEEFAAWLLDEVNAEAILEILNDPENAFHAALYERLAAVEEPTLKEQLEARVEELQNGIPPEVPALDLAAMTDEEFAAWLLDEVNAEAILEILNDPENAFYDALYERLAVVEDPALKEQLEARVEELQNGIPPEAPALDLAAMTDEEFAAWLLDEVNAEAILEILNDSENAFHDALYERLAAVEDPALREQLQARVQELFDILNPPAPWRGMTDEEFAAWLLDEVNAEAILEILNDPENAFHDALYERLAAVEDPTLKEQLQDRVQELFDILNPPAPWRGMTDEEFAAWLLDEVNAEAILEILNDPENAFHAALYERLAAVEDPTLKEQLEARMEELHPTVPETPEEVPPVEEPPAEEPGEGENPAEEPGEGEDPTEEPGEGENSAEEPGEGEDPTEEPGEGENSAEEPSEGEDPAEEPGEGEDPAEEPGEGEDPAEEPGEGEDPAEEPGEGGDPTEEPGEGEDPAEEPGEGEDPAEEPGEGGDPTEEPGEGEDPAEEPGEGEDPAEEPGEGEDPAEEPGEGEDPAEEPGEGEDPAEEPGEGEDPAEEPGEGEDPTEEPGEGEDPAEEPNLQEATGSETESTE